MYSLHDHLQACRPLCAWQAGSATLGFQGLTTVGVAWTVAVAAETSQEIVVSLITPPAAIEMAHSCRSSLNLPMLILLLMTQDQLG